MRQPPQAFRRLYPDLPWLDRWVDAVDDQINSCPQLAAVERWDSWARVTHFQNLHSHENPAAALYLRCRTPIHSLPFPSVRLRPRKSDVSIDFTFADLFAGIGGFHLALSSHGGTLAFASELDSAARITYAANYGVLPFGDIRMITRTPNGAPRRPGEIARRLPHVNVVAAGFPCQPFSRAGVSSRNHHGLEHGLNCSAQGTLFEDVLLVARAIKPEVLLFENVSNLASHDRGNTIRVILNEIDAIGYRVYPSFERDRGWAVFDSSLVIGQRRKRVYFAAIRKDLAADLMDAKGPLVIPPPIRGNGHHGIREAILNDDSMTDEEKFDRYGISEKLWKAHMRRDERHRKAGNGFRIGLIEDPDLPAPTLVARYFKDGKDCLIPHRDPSRPPRMLSPRECALLQTFPNRFRIPSSKSVAYKQFGNAVTIEVARQVTKSVLTYVFQ